MFILLPAVLFCTWIFFSNLDSNTSQIHISLKTNTENARDFLQNTVNKYNTKIIDYTCTFYKEEKWNGKFKKQIWKIKFAEQPFSVLMTNVKNSSDAKKVLYIENKFVNSKGKKCMVVEPASFLIRLFSPKILMPIDDPKILKRSRNTIEEFGFKNILSRLLVESRTIKLIRTTDNANVFECDGESFVVLHIDKITEIPIAIYVFENKKRENLIARYFYSKIKLNVGLTVKDFQI